MTHLCPECGLEHAVDVDQPIIAIDPEPAAAAEVEIARIEADRDVAVARIGAKVEEGWQEQRIAELEGRLAGMQEIIEQLTPDPEPEPVPVVIEAPEPDPVTTEPTTTAPPIVEPEPAKKRKGNPFWS